MKISIQIPNIDNITLELDDSLAPNTVKKILQSLPFEAGINLWGQEIYTDPTPIKTAEENAKSVVDLFDVGYWPPGSAICLFYGPTPLDKDRIRPYSPVNVIGKIKNPDKRLLSKIHDGLLVTFRQT